MMCYADLSVNVVPDNIDKVLGAAKRLGFIAVAVNELLSEEIRAGLRSGILTIPRRQVEVSRPEDLTKAISLVKPEEVLAVVPRNLDSFRRAGRLRRIDVIRVEPGFNIRPDKSERNLIHERGAAVIEFSLRPLLTREGDARDYMSWLRDVLLRSVQVGLRFILVSDASSEEELWHPAHVVSLLSSVGVPSQHVLAALSSGPGLVLSRLARRVPLQGILSHSP